MSHKVASPPLAPFAGGVNVVVDKNSSSSTEDGSWANPYKTIQAALNAKPVTTDYESTIWTVGVVPGVYEESLTLPAIGRMVLRSLGEGELVYLGEPGATTQNISWAPNGATTTMKISGFYVTGTFTFSVASGIATPALTLTDCTVADAMGGANSNPLNVSAIFDGCTITGAVSWDLLMTATSSTFSQAVTTYRVVKFQDTTVTGALTVTGSGNSASMSRCVLGSDATFTDGMTRLVDVQITGNLSVTGPMALVDNVDVGGTTTLGSVAPRIYNSRFTGLVTCTVSAFEVAHSSTFGSVTVGAAPTRGFFTCHLVGNFTGPAGSYRVDAVTSADSTVVLVGATEVVVGGVSVTTGSLYDWTAEADEGLDAASFVQGASPVLLDWTDVSTTWGGSLAVSSTSLALANRAIKIVPASDVPTNQGQGIAKACVAGDFVYAARMAYQVTAHNASSASSGNMMFMWVNADGVAPNVATQGWYGVGNSTQRRRSRPTSSLPLTPTTARPPGTASLLRTPPHGGVPPW